MGTVTNMDNFTDLINSNNYSQTSFFPKGSILQGKGDTVSKAYIVKRGLLRSYAIDEKGKEHVFMFAPENWILSDIEGHAMESPAELFIDAVEDTQVIIFDRNHFDVPQLSKEQLQSQFLLLIRRAAVLQQRIIMLMSSPASKRYEHFLEIYPDIATRVPQRMIASYLGITPEALSKIRGDLSKKK